MNKNSTPTVVFLTGKPACGKDTQAKLISKKFGFEIIITSEEIKKFLNSFKKKYLKIGKVKINVQKQKRLMEKGFLASFRFVSYLILNIIKRKIKNKKSIIFSGSPRTIYEAKQYLNFFKNQKNIRFYFFYLKISDKTAIQRALNRKEKRPDDNLKAIKRRLKVFREEIEPMLDYLKKQKVLIEINGENSPQKVFKDISNYLK